MKCLPRLSPNHMLVLMCSCGMKLRCNHGIVPSLYSAGRQVFPVAWIPVMSQLCGRRNFVLFATEIQRDSFPCGGIAIGKQCLEKSLFNAVFLLMTLC